MKGKRRGAEGWRACAVYLQGAWKKGKERPTGTETKKGMGKRAKGKGGNARERRGKRTESEDGRRKCGPLQSKEAKKQEEEEGERRDLIYNDRYRVNQETTAKTVMGMRTGERQGDERFVVLALSSFWVRRQSWIKKEGEEIRQRERGENKR